MHGIGVAQEATEETEFREAWAGLPVFPVFPPFLFKTIQQEAGEDGKKSRLAFTKGFHWRVFPRP